MEQLSLNGGSGLLLTIPNLIVLDHRFMLQKVDLSKMNDHLRLQESPFYLHIHVESKLSIIYTKCSKDL